MRNRVQSMSGYDVCGRYCFPSASLRGAAWRTTGHSSQCSNRAHTDAEGHGNEQILEFGHEETQTNGGTHAVGFEKLAVAALQDVNLRE